MFGRLLSLDIKYFFKGSLFALGQQLIGVTLGLTVSYLFGHFVSKELFGQYNLVLGFLGMLNFLGVSEIDTPLIKSTSQGYEGSLNLTARLKLKLSLIGVLFLVVAALVYFSRGDFGLSFALLACALFFPLYNSFTSYPAFLTAKRRFDLLAILASLASIFFVVITAFTIFFSKNTLGLIIGYLVGISVPVLIGYFFCLRLQKNRKIDPSLLHYGKFLTLVSVLPWISGHLGAVILGTVAGAPTLAVFAVASRFLTAVQKNFQVFYKPVTAKLAKQSDADQLKSIKTHWIKLLLIGMLLSFALWISVPWLITFFFTQNYLEAIPYARLLSLALIPLPLSWVASDLLIYQRKKAAHVVRSTVPYVIKIGLYVLIVPIWGIKGLVFIMLLDRFTEPLIPLYFLLRPAHKI